MEQQATATGTRQPGNVAPLLIAGCRSRLPVAHSIRGGVEAGAGAARGRALSALEVAADRVDLGADVAVRASHVGAVDAAKLEASRKSGVPVPGVHSPLWAPEREPTIKAAISAETAILMDLLDGK